MSDACDAFDAGVAELALEILEPAERDVLLAHAATCDRCSTELQQLSAAADRLTLLAPECEPPVGFEQRVMESLAHQRAEAKAELKAARLRQIRPVRMWHLAAAAAVLFVAGLGIGLLIHRHSGDGNSVADAPTTFRYADLVDTTGANHGSVALVADPGSPSGVVLTMSLADLDAGKYHCVIHLVDGTSTDVASWPIDESGAGAWAVPISNDIGDSGDIDDVHAVSVVDDSGSTVAVTDWSSASATG